jgi:hypothetical protein
MYAPAIGYIKIAAGLQKENAPDLRITTSIDLRSDI